MPTLSKEPLLCVLRGRCLSCRVLGIILVALAWSAFSTAVADAAPGPSGLSGLSDAFAPVVIVAPAAAPASPWGRAGALAVAVAAIAVLGVAVRRKSDLSRAVVLVGGASVVTRAFVPFALMHTQTDDLRLVAAARGIEGFTLDGFNAPSGMILPVIRFAMRLAGDNLEAAYLPSFLAGLLLPTLALLLGAAWFRSTRAGVWAAVPVLVSPAAWAFSGAISAYMIAATLFAGALVAGVLAGQRRGAVQAVLLVAAAVLLLVSALLKPEFLLLVPVHAALMLAAWRASGGRWRLSSLVPAVVVSLILVVAFRPYLAEFLVTALRRGKGPEGVWLERVLEYTLLGFLVFNPPFLPWKLVFLRSLFRRQDLALRALQAATLSLVFLYVLSGGTFGFNQWRHALLFLVLFHVAIAPEIIRLIESRRHWGVRLFVILLVLGDLAGYATYASWIRFRTDPTGPIRAAGVDAATLVIYAHHGQDHDPSNLLAAAGVPRSLPLDSLWPPSCPEGRDQALVALRGAAFQLMDRLEIYDVEKRCEVGTAFQDIRKLDADFAWLLSCLPPSFLDRAQALVDQMARIRAAVDPALCASDLEATAATLQPFDRVFLFVDLAPVEEEASWKGHEFVRREPLDLAAQTMTLEEPLRMDRPNLVAVRRVGTSDGRELWVRR